jgi:hypothetical protein
MGIKLSAETAACTKPLETLLKNRLGYLNHLNENKEKLIKCKLRDPKLEPQRENLIKEANNLIEQLAQTSLENSDNRDINKTAAILNTKIPDFNIRAAEFIKKNCTCEDGDETGDQSAEMSQSKKPPTEPPTVEIEI